MQAYDKLLQSVEKIRQEKPEKRIKRRTGSDSIGRAKRKAENQHAQEDYVFIF